MAQIAIATAKTARDIAGIEPRVAMLSFSTKGSAQHENVEKVVEATRIAKETDPSLKIDGELQADAALVPSVGLSKAPGSSIAGHANVLVFPSLDVGNIAYKLVQRIGNVQAVGPILQGLARPVNDLSRGCSAEDIFKTIIITCNQANRHETLIPMFEILIKIHKTKNNIMNILVLNCGSSSIKYKLIEIKANKVLAEGGVEKIGLHDAFIKFKLADGSKKIVELNISDHNGAIKAILDILTSPDYGSIKSFDEIDAVGHRVVHGGEKFNKSVLINNEVIAKIKECYSIAPLHNPVNMAGIDAITSILQTYPKLRFSTRLSIKRCRRILHVCPTIQIL